MGGRVWTQAEDQQLRAAKGRYGQLAAVGRQIGRSPGAVRVRLHALRSQDLATEPADIEHDQGETRTRRDRDIEHGAARACSPDGIGSEEIERRVNQQLEALRAQHLQGRTP